MNHNWLDRLARKHSNICIQNLTSTIVMGMGIVFVLEMFLSNALPMPLRYFLAFDRAAIFHGQIWRLITFIFIPPNTSMLWILMLLYFYWFIGSHLEGSWGTFRFNVFYFCGVLGTIVSGLITGYATNTFLNLSLFLAFAILYPNCVVRVFGLIPIEVKYLGMVAAGSLLLMFFRSTFSGKLSLIVSLINLLLFFGGDLMRTINNAKRRYEWRQQFKR